MGAEQESASSASRTVSREGCGFPPGGCGPPRSRVQKKSLSHKNASVSAFQKSELAADLCRKTQKEERTQTCSESERLLLYSNSNVLGGRESAIRESIASVVASFLKGFSVRAATITSITGSGGEHCSVGVQFAVSTRLARFITN